MNRYADQTVAVLGATGFIGRFVARALVGQGAQVHLLVRSAERANDLCHVWRLRVTVHELDLCDQSALARILADLRPAITFNLAGYGIDPTEQDEAEAHRVNTDLVECLARVVAEAADPSWSGQQLVHVGSAFEYGSAASDLAEDSVPAPTSWYGRSKLDGTRRLVEVARDAQLRAVTARLFTVYGPGEHVGRLLPSLVAAAASGEVLPLSAGLQRRDFTYVADVAEGLLRLAVSHAEPGAIVNLATGRLTTVREFAETAARILRIPHERLLFGALPVRPDEMSHQPVAIELLRSLTGWKPPTAVPEGIRRTVSFAPFG